jgi:hypothetical protein
VPNIRTFETPQLGLQPSEIGVEATAAAARRGGQFYNQAAGALDALGQRAGSAIKYAGDTAVNYMQHREISNGAAKLAQIEDGFTGAWQQLAANPNLDWNDPTIVQRFRAGMEPGLQKFKDSFLTEGGKQWAEGRIEQFREHMFHKTAADSSTMAAGAIAQNIEQTVNSATSRVYKDPSVKTLDDALAGLHDSINATVDSSPALDVSARANAKTSLFKQDEKLIKSAVMGAIRSGGDWEAIVKDPKYAKYINAAELDTFARAARSQDRTDQLQKKELERYQRQQKVQKGLDELSKVEESITWTPDGKPIVRPDLYQRAEDIAAKYGLHEVTDHARALQNFAASQQKERRESVVSDPETLTQLYSGLFNADKPTTDIDILSAATEHTLGTNDTRNLRELRKALEEAPLKGPLYAGNMKAVEGMLGIGVVPDGHTRYANFINEFIPQYLRLPPEQRTGALNTRDPESLISKAMQPYRPTDQELRDGWIANKFKGLVVSPTPAFVAPPGWEWNPARKQYRNPATGEIYDAAGKRVHDVKQPAQ